MAQFIAFEKEVEVNGRSVMSIINAFPDFMKKVGQQCLEKHNIFDVQPHLWYPQQSWLNCFKDISQKFGPSTLFKIGKAIPESAEFPPEIKTLQQALESIDIAYHLNHRNGEIGYYKLISYNNENQEAVMECKNPYPCDFDRGIITAMARKFCPKNILDINVELMKDKPSRLTGADQSHYIITWESGDLI